MAPGALKMMALWRYEDARIAATAPPSECPTNMNRLCYCSANGDRSGWDLGLSWALILYIISAIPEIYWQHRETSQYSICA